MKILGSMYLGYGAMMVCRQMVTILSVAIREDPTISVTNTDVGDFLGYGTIGAMAGKFVWGPLGDRIGGRATFLLGRLSWLWLSDCHRISGPSFSSASCSMERSPGDGPE